MNLAFIFVSVEFKKFDNAIMFGKSIKFGNVIKFDNSKKFGTSIKFENYL